MDYIVLDLEWNQNPYGKKGSKPGLPFEIIEIGAVRLNHKLEIEDSYQQVIKPRVYKKLHYKIKEITHLTNEELKKGMDFRKAIREFLKWCGDEYTFVTWGSMDLTELQKNMKYYKLERILDFPLYYVDLQKIYSLAYSDGHEKSTLSNAVEELKIKEDETFHRALSDAYYTAKIMQKGKFGRFKKRLSIDTFYSPRIREEEIFVKFDEYTKLVTREFLTKEEMFKDKNVEGMRCNQCGKTLERIIDWFSDSGKTYFCVGKCPDHGYVRGKIKIKKREADSFFAIKIMKTTDEAGVERIREKQESIREKRREKRQRSNEREVIDAYYDAEDNSDDDD
ncbi:MAG: exonuclease domain-containing protein [Eubacterium sp.]|nr:exonuclease domain-containing protein [Eubacterium sp.]